MAPASYARRRDSHPCTELQHSASESQWSTYGVSWNFAAIKLPSTYITRFLNASHTGHALVGPHLRKCDELCCKASKDIWE